jgi:hypothetical protein
VRHIRDLPDDDERLVAVADAYTARGWDAERFPMAGALQGWLVHLGYPRTGIPQEPDEFVTKWLVKERQRAS